MREVLDHHPDVVERAREAIRRAGLEPIERPIRGGTDGSRLSFMGLPTPNLFAGEHNFHSRLEWVSVQDMEKAVEVIVELARVWASELDRALTPKLQASQRPTAEPPSQLRSISVGLGELEVWALELDDSYCSVKFTVTVITTGDGLAVQQRRRELPLADRLVRRIVQHRDRAQDPRAG